jgi:hypothetical protein
MKAEQHIRTVEVHDRAGKVVGSKEVVLYAGLFSQAHEEGLARLKTSILQIPTEENGRLAIIKAEVETSKGLFEAIGDACPENADEFLAAYLIRVAVTAPGSVSYSIRGLPSLRSSPQKCSTAGCPREPHNLPGTRRRRCSGTDCRIRGWRR